MRCKSSRYVADSLMRAYALPSVGRGANQGENLVVQVQIPAAVVFPTGPKECGTLLMEHSLGYNTSNWGPVASRSTDETLPIKSRNN